MKNSARKFNGQVIGDAMDKTIVVQVDRVSIHPKYKKQFIKSKKYKVHDEKNEAKIGDKVEFAECRPLSREKRWKLVKIIKKKLVQE